MSARPRCLPLSLQPSWPAGLFLLHVLPIGNNRRQRSKRKEKKRDSQPQCDPASRLGCTFPPSHLGDSTVDRVTIRGYAHSSRFSVPSQPPLPRPRNRTGACAHKERPVVDCRWLPSTVIQPFLPCGRTKRVRLDQENSRPACSTLTSVFILFPRNSPLWTCWSTPTSFTKGGSLKTPHYIS